MDDIRDGGIASGFDLMGDKLLKMGIKGDYGIVFHLIASSQDSLSVQGIFT